MSPFERKMTEASSSRSCKVVRFPEWFERMKSQVFDYRGRKNSGVFIFRKFIVVFFGVLGGFDLHYFYLKYRNFKSLDFFYRFINR